MPEAIKYLIRSAVTQLLYLIAGNWFLLAHLSTSLTDSRNLTFSSNIHTHKHGKCCPGFSHLTKHPTFLNSWVYSFQETNITINIPSLLCYLKSAQSLLSKANPAALWSRMEKCWYLEMPLLAFPLMFYINAVLLNRLVFCAFHIINIRPNKDGFFQQNEVLQHPLALISDSMILIPRISNIKKTILTTLLVLPGRQQRKKVSLY